MLDPDLAMVLHRRGEWRNECPVDRCPVETQGGITGLAAHLQVVHRLLLHQPGGQLDE